MIDLSKLQILETTLRDGSYLLDFQFTSDDTARLTGILDQLGMRLIEIGHGVGINASATKGEAAASDVDYIHAARSTAKNALIGMFCIPGIAELDHLRACADAGLQFVRVGANVDDYQATEAFINEARKLDLMVFTNFMKSYAMEADDFADIAKISEDFGSQAIYVVDSAGGMMPEEVTRYVSAVRQKTDLPVGFHGHNNLNLAVANSMAAIDAGATIVDTTLLGMGRSSGNAPTEIMVPVLQRRYDACGGFDPLLFVELAERAIAPLLKNRWDDSEKTALGLAQVHSMYTRQIRRAAQENDLNYFGLIAEIGSRDKLNLPEAVMDESVRATANEKAVVSSLGDLSMIPQPRNSGDAETIAAAAQKIYAPVETVVTTSSSQCSVSIGNHAIRVICTADEARTLEAAARERNVRILYLAGTPDHPVSPE